MEVVEKYLVLVFALTVVNTVIIIDHVTMVHSCTELTQKFKLFPNTQ